jgi:RNA polymerase sigma-54 factor
MQQMRQEFVQKQEQRMQTVLAPELRQSLQYLQVPLLELQALVQQELETNPTLEEQPLDSEQIEIEPGTSELAKEEMEESFGEEFEVLARLDDEWGDYFRQNRILPSGSQQDERERHNFIIDSLTESESLQDHLLEQLKYLGLSDRQRSIAELLIGNIDSDGYLRSSLGELSETTGIGSGELEEILDMVQDFHPIGVGARSLQECLELQLRRLGIEDPHIYAVVSRHLDNLARKRYSAIADTEKISLRKVHRIAELIATLEPRPGRIFGDETSSYVQPEATIRRSDGGYRVIMHNEYIPRLHISELYKQMMRDPKTGRESKEYIRKKIQGAVLLVRSIEQRQQTLESICHLILDVQYDFMEQGMQGMKPLVMSDISDKLGVHETTVSRAIANKYIRTPQGVFEMKFFFNPGYRNKDGSQVSSRSIMDMIKNMIEEEESSCPLSDQAIVDILAEKGFDVARRTVAKYRNRLKIPSSHQRKIS